MILNVLSSCIHPDTYICIYIYICVIGVMIFLCTWEVGPVQQLNPLMEMGSNFGIGRLKGNGANHNH